RPHCSLRRYRQSTAGRGLSCRSSYSRFNVSVILVTDCSAFDEPFRLMRCAADRLVAGEMGDRVTQRSNAGYFIYSCHRCRNRLFTAVSGSLPRRTTSKSGQMGSDTARAQRGGGPHYCLRFHRDRWAADVAAKRSKSNSTLGPIASIGIVFAMLSALTLLPAILFAFGKVVFWPKRVH